MNIRRGFLLQRGTRPFNSFSLFSSGFGLGLCQESHGSLFLLSGSWELVGWSYAWAKEEAGWCQKKVRRKVTSSCTSCTLWGSLKLQNIGRATWKSACLESQGLYLGSGRLLWRYSQLMLCPFIFKFDNQLFFPLFVYSLLTRFTLRIWMWICFYYQIE